MRRRPGGWRTAPPGSHRWHAEVTLRRAGLYPFPFSGVFQGMRPSLTARVAVALLLLGAAGPVTGQVRIPTELRSATREVAAPVQADSLFFQDPAVSLAFLEGQLARDAADYALQWRAARAALTLGILEDREEVEFGWISRAAAHADSALALNATEPEGLFWSAASKGRLALHHGPRTSSALAQEVWDLANRLLELEPDHAGAHNILGKLNQEVMSLSGWQRFLGKVLLRSEPLQEATWEKALDHHTRAVAAEPDGVLFHLDLGRTLQLMGEEERAREVFRTGLALPAVYPVDRKFQELMAGYLAELGG